MVHSIQPIEVDIKVWSIAYKTGDLYKKCCLGIQSEKLSFVLEGVYMTVEFEQNTAKQNLITELKKGYDLLSGDIEMLYQNISLSEAFQEGYDKYGSDVEDPEVDDTKEHYENRFNIRRYRA